MVLTGITAAWFALFGHLLGALTVLSCFALYGGVYTVNDGTPILVHLSQCFSLRSTNHARRTDFFGPRYGDLVAGGES